MQQRMQQYMQHTRSWGLYDCTQQLAKHARLSRRSGVALLRIFRTQDWKSAGKPGTLDLLF